MNWQWCGASSLENQHGQDLSLHKGKDQSPDVHSPLYPRGIPNPGISENLFEGVLFILFGLHILLG